MQFVIKTATKPYMTETTDWVVMEEKDTKTCVLDIMGKLFEIDKESFEMLYSLYESKLLNPLWTIVLDDKHIFIWPSIG